MSETVVVTQPPASPPTPPEPDGPSDLEIGAALGAALAKLDDHELRLQRLENHDEIQDAELDAIEDQVEDTTEAVVATAEAVSDVAAATADVAEAVEEVAAEPAVEVVQEPEPDQPPGKTHWFTRPASEWRGER